MNVLIATDDPRTCRELRGLLAQQIDDIAQTCVGARSLQENVRAIQPDLILLDWELTGRSPAALLFGLDHVDRGPSSPWSAGRWPAVIVLSERREVEAVALACGAAAFVPKCEASAMLGRAVQRVLRLRTYATAMT